MPFPDVHGESFQTAFARLLGALKPLAMHLAEDQRTELQDAIGISNSKSTPYRPSSMRTCRG
jgi:hypothetical protein